MVKTAKKIITGKFSNICSLCPTQKDRPEQDTLKNTQQPKRHKVSFPNTATNLIPG